jgi:hypothetical protein
VLRPPPLSFSDSSAGQREAKDIAGFLFISYFFGSGEVLGLSLGQTGDYPGPGLVLVTLELEREKQGVLLPKVVSVVGVPRVGTARLRFHIHKYIHKTEQAAKISTFVRSLFDCRSDI